MEFSVENLPAGLTVNPKNGHITGRITSAEKKTYHVTLQAKNSKGSDAKAFRIVVGEQIALTPPLGWNSWNCWHQKVSQAKVLESAKAMSDAGLQRVGWMYINMDDGWQAKRGGKHNAVMPNTKFPDMKGMVDEIHAMGFKAGSTTLRGWARMRGIAAVVAIKRTGMIGLRTRSMASETRSAITISISGSTSLIRKTRCSGRIGASIT